MRILVVEDEAAIAAFIHDGLVKAGYGVDLAPEGAEALHWVAIASYDLIILDVMLPDMDGLSLCETLRRIGIAIPVLMLTARETIEDRVAGLDSGADDYLVKPFAFAELLARIRALLRREPAFLGTVLHIADLSLDTRSHIEHTLYILLVVLLVMAPITVLLASGGGLFLAHRALSPIDAITRMAQRISAENLSGRIGLTGPDDEVGRLARTFDTMLARLEEAFTQQRQFAADASHELRTPLTAIIGQIDVALGWPESAEYYRATLAGIREQAQRLTRLASDLLFLARTDAQPMPQAVEPIDLGSLLPAVVTQMEPLAAERQQTIIATRSPTGMVYGNEDQLIRMLLNVLDNAIRYTPAGGRVTLGCRRRNATLEISVGDTGPGIAPEHLPRLFDRFYRVDRGRSRAQGGSGLGLAIAQSIAQLHGGQISVESIVGQGTIFIVQLPILSSASRYAHVVSIPPMQPQGGSIY